MFWLSVPAGVILMFASVAFIKIDKAEFALAKNIDFLADKHIFIYVLSVQCKKSSN